MNKYIDLYNKLYDECLKENNLLIIDDFINNLKGQELKLFCKENNIKYNSKEKIIKDIKKWFKIKYNITKNIY